MRTSLAFRLSGWVRVELRGMYAGRVLDGCAREGVAVENVEALPVAGMAFTVRLADFPALRPLTRRNACRLHIRDRGGLPFGLRQFRGRFVLAAGLLAALAVFWCLTGLIWSIEVTGNETLSAGQILRALEPYGVVRGARIASVYNEDVRNGVLRELGALSWITVRFEGSHAVVEVRERTVPPAVADDDEPCDIVAAQSGLVTMVRARQGTALVEKGQIVEAGDLLAAGEIRYRANPGGWPEEYSVEPIRADAEVWARVWQTARAAAPLETFEKRETGRTVTRWALILGARRLDLSFSADFFGADCDILTSRRNLFLLPGVRLPVSLVRETYTCYDRVSAQSDEAALTQALLREAQTMLEGWTAGEALTVDNVRTAVIRGTVYASVTGETVRNIALPVRRP